MRSIVVVLLWRAEKGLAGQLGGLRPIYMVYDSYCRDMRLSAVKDRETRVTVSFVDGALTTA
jgi:hypothetical protein